MGADRRHLLARLENLLGARGLLQDAAARRVYALDSSHITWGEPWVVALPGSQEELSRVLALCHEHQVPVVCRGSGTGLSGGAVPPEGALVLGTARLQGHDAFCPDRGTIRVEVGVLNEQVSSLVADRGFHFAPDPSSQMAATIGGNIAENAGGPHCLRYGVTLQHLRNLQWADATGRIWSSSRGLPLERGLDLTSLLCGSEGTLAVVTAADLRVVPDGEKVVTLLAFFPDLNEATVAVVSLLTAGLLPVAVEMVDQAMLQAVEQAFGFGFPTDVEGAMIVEFSGSAPEVAEDAASAQRILTEGGARDVRRAVDQQERLELWKCRKKAFGAVGRLAPRYVTMDVVVPLGRLPELVRRIQEIKTRHGVDVATAFHAGDGNLHPGVHFDDRQPGQQEKAHQAADEIIRAALAMDGSATGEHGVGLEKKHALPWQLDAQADRLSRGIKEALDPGLLLNPGKAEAPAGARFALVKPCPTQVEYRWDSMSVTAPAATRLAEIQKQALQRGLCLPVGVFQEALPGTLGLGAGTTVGDLLAQGTPGPALLAMGSARDFLLELWARTGDDQLFHTGAPVFKNVAGYGLGPALCGSGRHFVTPLAGTFQLRPVVESVLVQVFSCSLPTASESAQHLRTVLPADEVASPVVVWDQNMGLLTVISGGRNRPWGLEDLAQRIRNSLPEFQCREEQIIPTEKLANFWNEQPGWLPAWAHAASNWSWLTGAVQNRPDPLLPLAVRCWIWQAVPGIWWTPDQVLGAEKWFVDPLLAEGKINPIPEPGNGVPRPLVQKLKILFDPQGNLEPLPWSSPESST